MLQSFLLGGLLPVIAFTVIEEYFGTVWGIFAGMVFGLGEILWEWRTQGRVSAITWGGNLLLIILGAVSLIAQEGIWFKLQPAIMEAVMAIVLIGSYFMRKPLVAMMAEKQNPHLPPFALAAMSGLTLRLGIFILLNALLATWAAVYWSTAAWAFLKGIGFTLSLFLYIFFEGIYLRKRAIRIARTHAATTDSISSPGPNDG